MEPTKELVYSLYQDPLTLGNERRIVQVLRERGYRATEQSVRNLLGSHQLWQRTRRIKRVFMPIVGRTGQYQLDIMFFPHRLRNVPILTMVHMTTRYAMARVLNNRRMKPNIINDVEDVPEIVRAMREMIDEADDVKMPIKALVCDNEFNKTTFKKFLKAHRIGMYNPDPRDKGTVGMIESFNFVLRKLLNHFVEIHGDAWKDAMPKLLKNYNNTVHSRTKRAPRSVTPRDELRIRGQSIVRMFPAMRLLNSFKPGETVRYAVRPTPVQATFYKYGPIFSRDLDKVDSVKGFSIELDNQPGKFRPRNLLRVDQLGIDETQDAKPVKPMASKQARKAAANMRMEMRKLESKVNFPDRRRTQRNDDIYVRIKQVKRTSLARKTPKQILGTLGEGENMKFVTEWVDGDQTNEPMRTFIVRKKPHPVLIAYLQSVNKMDLLEAV